VEHSGLDIGLGAAHDDAVNHKQLAHETIAYLPKPPGILVTPHHDLPLGLAIFPQMLPGVLGQGLLESGQMGHGTGHKLLKQLLIEGLHVGQADVEVVVPVLGVALELQLVCPQVLPRELVYEVYEVGF
jgi:hypothetical protein